MKKIITVNLIVLLIYLFFTSCSTNTNCDYEFMKPEMKSLAMNFYKNVYPTQFTDSPYIKGKVLIVYYYPQYIVDTSDKGKFYCDMNQKLPDDLKFRGNMDSVGTIIFYQDKSRTVGQYSDGKTANQLYADLHFVDKETGKYYYLATFNGGSPPKVNRRRRGRPTTNNYGNFTDKDEIIYFITSLDRK